MDGLSSSQHSALNQEMRCSILSNPKGEIVILHDRDIASDIQWIEFHRAEDALFLIHEDGMAQDLGIVLDTQMRQNLSHGLEVSLVRMDGGQAVSQQKVTIVIQNY